MQPVRARVGWKVHVAEESSGAQRFLNPLYRKFSNWRYSNSDYNWKCLLLMFAQVLTCARLPRALYLGARCAERGRCFRHRFMFLFSWAKLKYQLSLLSFGGIVADIT